MSIQYYHYRGIIVVHWLHLLISLIYSVYFQNIISLITSQGQDRVVSSILTEEDGQMLRLGDELVQHLVRDVLDLVVADLMNQPSEDLLLLQ